MNRGSETRLMPFKWVGIDAYLAALGIFLGIVVAAATAPKSEYFAVNFLVYWGSQLIILVVPLLVRPRPAVIGGIAAALAAYLAVFWLWLFSIHAHEGLEWIGYFFSLPGGFVAAAIVAVRQRSMPSPRLLAAFGVAVGYVLLGISVNQALVCSTVLHCSIR